MTSSANQSILSEKSNLDDLSRATRAYFQNRTKNRVHRLVVTKFRQEEAAGRLTQAKLARRTGKTPAQISRILSYPSNLGLETLSDLLLAICGEELDATSSDPEKRPRANSRSKEILGVSKAPRREPITSGATLLVKDDAGNSWRKVASSADSARPALEPVPA